jgi:hypothetical protein
MSELYELPTIRKKLSKEELLKKSGRIYQEDFPINKPEFDGEVTIRAVSDQGEFENIQAEITRLTKISEHVPIGGKKRQAKDIYVAVYCCQCMVDPDLTIDETFQMIDNLGPVATLIANRILTISGLTSGSVDVAEEKLRNDSFPTDAVSSKFQISQEASE